MPNIWLISDTHFGHENIIKYADRPFINVREMDEALIENWNRLVRPSDHVYHLGDVYMGRHDRNSISNILYRLNGHKRLIVGNHDEIKDVVLHRHFAKISMMRVFREYNLVLTHVPVHPNSLELTKGHVVNVHGHIHQHKSPPGPYINVCVEWTDYTPVNIEDVAARAKKLLTD